MLCREQRRAGTFLLESSWGDSDQQLPPCTSPEWAVGTRLGLKSFSRCTGAALQRRWGEDRGLPAQPDGAPSEGLSEVETLRAAAATTNSQRPRFLISLSPLGPENKAPRPGPGRWRVKSNSCGKSWASWFHQVPRALLCGRTRAL